MLRSDAISAATGLMGLTTVVGTVLGAAIGNILTDVTRPRGQGISGNLCVRADWHRRERIPGQPADCQRAAGRCHSPFSLESIAADARRFPHSRRPPRHAARCPGEHVLLEPWFPGQYEYRPVRFEGNLSSTAAENQTLVAPLLASLALGVGIGSVLAGLWSAGRVELGLLPVGGMAIATGSIAMCFVQGGAGRSDATVTPSYLAACAFLVLLGIGGGMFDVPLQSYLQHRSPPESRGSILAASNFLTFSGILLFSAFFCLLRFRPAPRRASFDNQTGFSRGRHRDHSVCVYIVWLIPQTTIRFLVWLASMTIYRVHVVGSRTCAGARRRTAGSQSCVVRRCDAVAC